MSLLDIEGLSPEFIEPVEFEEVELVESGLDVGASNEGAAVVYVNNDSDNFLPEEVYQWSDGTVTFEKVVDSGEEIALQPFDDVEGTVYNDPQFELVDLALIFMKAIRVHQYFYQLTYLYHDPYITTVRSLRIHVDEQ
ncbi:hypothetical protein COOONC_03701 [Cooperia oncophora]